MQQGKPGALPLAERAAQLQPDSAAILDTLALVAIETSDLKS